MRETHFIWTKQHLITLKMMKMVSHITTLKLNHKNLIEKQPLMILNAS